MEKVQLKLLNYPEFRPYSLQIEILENNALKDANKIIEIIKKCDDIGISFALDDFGTGYSSLAYLRDLPARTLKIDQTFIYDMLENERDLAIVKGILALSKTFQLETIAEGVETENQFIMLKELGCEIAQGYYIAHPMPANDCIEFLKN